MKKNITINLCGRLFAIDEDAYEMLSTYEQSLRKYFCSREGGEEIADDIEARIAELFDELKSQGTEAITIEHVQDVIHRIGEPDEMEGTSPEQPTAHLSSSEGEKDASNDSSPREGREGAASRRLYRNMADRKFMGVLSGLAAYFGGDVLWWRLGYVFMLLANSWAVGRFPFWNYWGLGFNISGSLVIAYIVLAILMPVAATPEDRLRMKGKKVTPQNLADEVSQPQPTNLPGDGPKGCINGIFLILGNLFRWFLYLIGVMVAFWMLVGVIFIIALMMVPHELITAHSPEFWQYFDGHYMLFVILALATILVLLIPTYCILHSLLNEFGQLRPMGFRQRVLFLIAWIVAFIAAAAIGTSVAGKVIQAEKANRDYIEKQYREENTHDGIFYQPHEWEFLSKRGWKVLRADGCNDRYTTIGQYYYEADQSRYIDTYSNNHEQLFTIERSDSLQPGTYRLTACVRADGQGAFLFALYGEERLLHQIPVSGNEGGNIWQRAMEQKDSIEAYVSADKNIDTEYKRICSIANAHGGKGFGWNRETLPDIVVKLPTRLRYGVSTEPSITHSTWLGHWFSACDFELTRVK